MNKKQLQQTLREMGIDYPPGATHANLVEILDRENQNQWMKSAAGRVIKINKRAGTNPAQAGGPDLKSRASAKARPVSGRPPLRAPGAGRVACTVFERPKQPDASPPGKPTPEPARPAPPQAPIFDPRKDLEDYALKRAAGVCDLCETLPAKAGQKLKAFLFSDQPGRQPTVKNVAALCPGCFSRIESEGLGSAIKVLKRKARSKVNSDPKISHRNQEKFTAR